MWYYVLNGQQQGPVTEEQLRELIFRRGIRQDTLVWRAGMPDWLPAQKTELARYFFGPPVIGAQPSYAEQGQSLARRDESRFSAKIKPSAILGLARAKISGRWGTAIGFSVLFGLLSIGIELPFSTAEHAFGPETLPGIFASLLGSLMAFILFGPLEVGALRYWLNFTRGYHAEYGQMFSGFGQFGRALGINFFLALIIMLCMVVAAIPGGIIMVVGAVAGAGGLDAMNGVMITGMVVFSVSVFVVVAIMG